MGAIRRQIGYVAHGLWHNLHLVFMGMVALVLLFVVGLQLTLLNKANESLARLQRQSDQIKAAVIEIGTESQEQHDRLLDQISCLAEVSVVAAEGNDVTVQSFDDCKYTVAPAASDEPHIIFRDQVIRESHHTTTPSGDDNNNNNNNPGQGRGRVKELLDGLQ